MKFCKKFSRGIWFLLVFLALVGLETQAQPHFGYEETARKGEVKLDYGINIGGYFANRGTANYYNGSSPFHYTSNVSKLEHIFENASYEQIIREQVGNFPYNLPPDPYPDRMAYRATFMVGLFGAISFSPAAAIIGDFNLTRLKAEDWFVLNVIRNPVGLPEENIMLLPIWGVEERFDIRLGFQYTVLSQHSYIHPFFELGGNVTNVIVKENSIRVGTRTFNLHRPQTDLYYTERDYGIGFGGFTTFGVKMNVNEQYSLWAGYSANMNQVNLGVNKQFLLQHSVFLRLSLAGVL